MHRLVSAASLAVALAAPTAAFAGYTPVPGACVFSKSEIPKGEEASYQLSTEFHAGDSIYMRCYFKQTPGEAAKDGKMKNTLRAPIEETISAQAEGPAWRATMTWTDDPMWYFKIRFPYVPSDTATWNQQRYDQPVGTDTSLCDWKDMNGACVDMEQETINLGKKLGKTGTYTTEVCVEPYYEKVDVTKLGDDGRQHDVVVWASMAKGCFKYTVDVK